MSEPTITCPSCSTEIKLTESLAAPLIEATRREYEEKLTLKERSLSKREAALQAALKKVEEDKQSIDAQVAEGLKSGRAAIVAEEAKKARATAALDLDQKTRELSELQGLLAQRDEKLVEAQKAQEAFIRKERELEDEKRELDLTVQKRVQASAAEIYEKARHETEEALKLKNAEKDEHILSLQREIDALKRKAEQGSQQLQGEALELVLERALGSSFPLDDIKPVGKGEFGGDVVQKVSGPTGQTCGTILWESKRTKNWSQGWLVKLRADQRAAGAEIAVLVSEALPQGLQTFEFIDGIWITAPRYATCLAAVLRQTLVDVANARQVQEGQETKMERLYEYLTSPKFRHRIEAIVEKISDMQQDLLREKKTTMRLWAKREAQIEEVIRSTVGMYGDLQGIVGAAFQEIEGLEVSLLETDLKDTCAGDARSLRHSGQTARLAVNE
jgi:hypothetical protein